MILGFTGTQNGMNGFQKDEFVKLLNNYKPVCFHHGDCIGADSQAHYLFLHWHCDNNTTERKIIIHPPENSAKRANVRYAKMGEVLFNKLRNVNHLCIIETLEPKPYHARNHEIVLASSILIAATKEMDHTVRSGTWSTIRKGWHERKTVIVIPPIGND